VIFLNIFGDIKRNSSDNFEEDQYMKIYILNTKLTVTKSELNNAIRKK
jgi:hypothetical protein